MREIESAHGWQIIYLLKLWVGDEGESQPMVWQVIRETESASDSAIKEDDVLPVGG